MELKELSEKTLRLFECDDTSQLSEKLFEAVVNNDFSKITGFLNIVDDLSVDWLQKIFQYYEADREEKNRIIRQNQYVNLFQNLQKQAVIRYMMFVQAVEH